MPAATPTDTSAIRDVLSVPRMSTYLNAAGGDLDTAMNLYGWNARASAALMVPFHFTEVAIRNAASEALTSAYGPDWPWQAAFENTLPSPSGPVFNPKRELTQTRRKHGTAGKVIADLKFAFWVNIFTRRHDGRLWDHRILGVFPHASGTPARGLRNRIHGDLEEIRKLRNRVAHHEPIFDCDLDDHVGRMLELIEFRSTSTSKWVLAMEEVTELLDSHPLASLMGTRP